MHSYMHIYMHTIMHTNIHIHVHAYIHTTMNTYCYILRNTKKTAGILRRNTRIDREMYYVHTCFCELACSVSINNVN